MGRYDTTQKLPYCLLGYYCIPERGQGAGLKNESTYEYGYAYESGLETLTTAEYVVGTSFKRQIYFPHEPF